MRQLTSRRSERAVKLLIFGFLIWPEEIQACWNIQICMCVLCVKKKKHYSYIHCLVALTYFLELKFVRVRRNVLRSIFSAHGDALVSNHRNFIGFGRAICYLWCAEFPWRTARIAERRTHFLVSAYEETKTLLDVCRILPEKGVFFSQWRVSFILPFACEQVGCTSLVLIFVMENTWWYSGFCCEKAKTVDVIILKAFTTTWAMTITLRNTLYCMFL